MEIYSSDLIDHPAWQQAWRLRCCPPDHLLTQPPNALLTEHLNICPWCQENLTMPPWPTPAPEELIIKRAKPSPGQLYTLDPQLAGWGPKARYYNPPVVLILACPDEHSVLVSQTYGEPAMAGPGDIELGSTFTGFAQPWNCYTLQQTDLDLCLGTVDKQVAPHVQHQHKAPWFDPKPGSLLWFFRHMEVETGYFFSSRAVSELITAHDNRLLTGITSINKKRMLEDLHGLPVRLPSSATATTSPLELLFRAEPDLQQLPLAAADTKTQPALIFTVKNNQLTTAHTADIVLSGTDYANGLLTITGTIASLPPGNHAWLFRWHVDGQLIEPAAEHTGYDNQLFWVTFMLTPAQTRPPARLVVRLLCEPSG
ncbi:MAG: hypothetical protein RBQ88_02515 [Desulfobulbus oligotrophicus]|jgi:hypothetical protein|nr:hypothetical protein [Desulfobulbus oligotrophicus]